MLITFICLLMGKKADTFKADTENVNFLLNFVQEAYLNESNEYDNSNESKEVFSEGNVYDFSVHFRIIDKCDILRIQVYLIVKNNIK